MLNHIQNYYRKLDDLRRIAGSDNEGALRTAFQILLDTLGQEHGLILHNEYPFTAPNGSQLRIDGALIDRLRLVHGYWEAKDEKDDLDKEIEIKLASAVLVQFNMVNVKSISYIPLSHGKKSTFL